MNVGIDVWLKLLASTIIMFFLEATHFGVGWTINWIISHHRGNRLDLSFLRASWGRRYQIVPLREPNQKCMVIREILGWDQTILKNSKIRCSQRIAVKFETPRPHPRQFEIGH